MATFAGFVLLFLGSVLTVNCHPDGPTGLVHHPSPVSPRSPLSSRFSTWSFSWVVPHGCAPAAAQRASSVRQVAYQWQLISVLSKESALVYDTGVVKSSSSSSVRLPASFATAHEEQVHAHSLLAWRVRLWLRQGHPSSLNKSTTCTTFWSDAVDLPFVQSVSAFNASVTHPVWNGDSNATYVLFRKTINTPAAFGRIQRAYAVVTGALDNAPGDGQQRLLGSYRLFVNGAPLGIGPGRGVVPAGATTMAGNLMYDVINFTAFVAHSGPVVLALQARHVPKGAFVAVQWALFNGSATLEGGTDDTWWSYNANDIFVQGRPDTCGRVNENIDVRQTSKIGGATYWRTPSFKPASPAWTRAVVVTSSVPVLTSLLPKSTLPLVPAVSLETPTEVVRTPGTTQCMWFFQFSGEAMAGLFIKFAGGTANEMVQVKLSEQLNGTDNVLYPESSSNHYISVFTLPSGGGTAEQHEYPGLWRYGTVLFLNRTTSSCPSGAPSFSVRRWTVAYPFQPSDSSFNSSDDMLNAVWDLCKRSLQVTSLDTFTDSNTRERLPYEADGWITAMSRWALQREYSWPRHSAAHVIQNPTWPTEWKHFTILLAHSDYMETGSTALVEDDDIFELMVNSTMLPFINPVSHLVNWTGLVTRYGWGAPCHNDPTNPFGVPHASSCDIVDWPPQYRAGYAFTVVNTVVNAFTAKSLLLLGNLANATGRQKAASMLFKQSTATYQSIRENLLDKKTQLFCDGVCANSTHSSFHAQHFPLWLGVVDSVDVAHTITSYLRGAGMVGSVYAASSLLRGLYQAAPFDQGHTALELLTQCGNQSWCNMLRHNATATWETWAPQGGTHSHPWSSTPGSVIASGFMGIRALEPGFARWEAKPQSGGVPHATITRPTIKGPIHTSLVDEAKDGRRTYTLRSSVPANTEARLCVPHLGAQHNQVQLNGQWAVGYRVTGSHVCVDVGSTPPQEPHTVARTAAPDFS